MIFVGGISSSGKTHLLSLCKSLRPSLIILSGSGILREAGRPLRPLTPQLAEENQWVLLQSLRDRGILSTAGAILDGHATIETTEGARAVPDAWYDQARISGMLHVEALPEEIAARRANRGLSWTAKEAAALQVEERTVMNAQASRLDCPFSTVSSSDPNAMLMWIDRVITNAGGTSADR